MASTFVFQIPIKCSDSSCARTESIDDNEESFSVVQPPKAGGVIAFRSLS